MKYLKLFENMEKAKSIISKKMKAFDSLKDLLKNNLGYIGKFTEYLINNNVPYKDLENLYKDLLEIKSKGSPIDISELSYEECIDEVIGSKDDIFVKSVVNQFPSAQKKLIDEIVGANGISIIKNLKGRDISALISKISRYKTKEELKSAIKIFSSDSRNDRKSVLEYVDGSESASVSFKNDNILIIRINKIEDVQELGSDTSWCILQNWNWNSYTKNRYQYILFDYTKDDLDRTFKIGFTLNKDFTVYAAHDILDKQVKNLLDEILNREGVKLTGLEKREIVDISSIKINKRITINNLNLLIDNTPKDKMMDLIKSLIPLGLPDSKLEILKSVIIKYYFDKEIVTPKDIMRDGGKPLMDLCDKFDFFQTGISKFLDPKIIKWNKIDDVFLTKYIDVYTDESFLTINSYDITGIMSKKFKFNETNLKKIYDRLIKINQKIGQKPHQQKIQKLTDCIQLIDRGIGINLIPLSEIGRSNKYFISNNIDILKIPIDYVDLYYPKTFEYLVQKNYSGISVTMNNCENLGPLLESLEGNDLQFIIDRKFYNRVKNGSLSLMFLKNSVNAQSLTDEFVSLVKKFPKGSKIRDKVERDPSKKGKWEIFFLSA